ncbi:ribonuclease HI family protein [Chloroflexota bacterium]
MRPERVAINTDGASRGNPGPAAIGATIRDGEGQLLARISQHIGIATNNQAEYRAVITALQEALKLGARIVDIRLDSELVVKQVNGRYRVRNAALRPLFQTVKQLTEQLEAFTITHVPRRQNAEADRLANMALR